MNNNLSEDLLRQIVADATKPLEDKLNGIHARLESGDSRMMAIEGSIAKNNAETSATLAASKEMLEAFDFAKRGLVFFGAIGTFAAKLAKVGLTIGAFYTAVRGWKWPWTK